MTSIYSNTDIVSIYRNNFLCLSLNGTPIDILEFKNKCCIYTIENLINHKKYVGKTVNLLNRANNYIWNYRINKDLSSEELSTKRTIIRAMAIEGIANFRMYPIDIADDRVDLAQKEKDYIINMNLTDHKNGYNDVVPNEMDIVYRIGRKPFAHSIETRMKKSKLVACINITTKTMYISVGMKLFGDLIGFTKDVVKNNARRESQCGGFYIIYLNDTDRNTMKDDCLIKVEDLIERRRIARSKNKYSDRSYAWQYIDHNCQKYIECMNNVEEMLNNFNAKNFVDLGYTCKFINYKQDQNNNTTYDFYNIDEAFNYISQF